MSILLETDNFIVETRNKPHISRTDGGHITISPKIPVTDRTQLLPELAKELMKLTMVVGESMKIVLNRNGVDVERINYQDNGNWKPQLHIHLYGRAKSAIVQKWGHALMFPKTLEEFQKNPPLEPLSEKDISDLKQEIKCILESKKYKYF